MCTAITKFFQEYEYCCNFSIFTQHGKLSFQCNFRLKLTIYLLSPTPPTPIQLLELSSKCTLKIVSPPKKKSEKQLSSIKVFQKRLYRPKIKFGTSWNLEEKILIIFFHSSEVLKLILRLSSYFLNPEPQRLFPPRENTIRKY